MGKNTDKRARFTNGRLNNLHRPMPNHHQFEHTLDLKDINPFYLGARMVEDPYDYFQKNTHNYTSSINQAYTGYF